ncbi:hypothetical protein FBUS_04329 [Fasciolopsis buskii]|uniref:Uncharacterized protein n=1 Tax=Fasciolopsis buskii TaxID=27845 RepID=A0A8E0RQ01_9TREM|nr:hypothetical protein FBUS_04329 [Fasciolopsis buski]
MESSSREECKLNAVSLDHLGSELHALEHRRNYETLKTAYEQLKGNFIRSREVWKSQSRQMQMKERQAIAKLEEANIQIHTLLKELSSNARVKNEPELIESIRLEIQQRYEDEINRARSCILAAREESKKLNDEIVTLQSHLEFTKTDAQAALQQQQILYEAEIANLRHIKEDLLSRNQCLSSNELDRNKDDCREKAQLETKCQLLMDEVENLKKTLDSQKVTFLSGNENLLKNVTNLKIQNCELEAERENLNRQLSVMRQEVEHLRSELHFEKQRADDAVHTSTEAEYKLSQLTQRTRGELANLRLEAQEQRTAIEKQRDQFASKAQELEHKLEIMSARCQQMESDTAVYELASIEKEAIARDQWIREKTLLEARCTELSSRLKATQMKSSTNELGIQNEVKFLKRLSTEMLCLGQSRFIPFVAWCEQANEKSHNDQSSEVGQLQLTLLEKLKERDELKASLHSARVNLKRYMEDASKKKQQLCRHIRRLKEANQLKKLEMEKLKTENEILK